MSKEGVINNAKSDFEAIKKYATEEAMKEIQKRIQPKLNEMLEKSLDESITVDADNASIKIDDDYIEVNKGDSKVVVDTKHEDSSLIDTTVVDNSQEGEGEKEEEEFEIVTSSEPIQEEDMIFEIKVLNEEEEQISTSSTDVIDNNSDMVSNPFQIIIDKLNGIEKKIEGGTTASSAEGEVEVIDDSDTQITPPDNVPALEMQPESEPKPEDALPAPAASVPAAIPSAPVIKEFNLQEYENMEEKNKNNDIVNEIMSQLQEAGYEFENSEEEIIYELQTDFVEDDEEFEEEEEFKDSDIEFDNSEEEFENDDEVEGDLIITLSDENGDSNFECNPINDDDDDDDFDELEIVSNNGNVEDVSIIDSNDNEEEEEEIEEMLGLGHTVRHSQKLASLPDVPHKKTFKESQIKAQYESKMDELIKENNSLKKDIREFEESFVELRNSIDEMQTFNAKLALANKLFLNGGLSNEDKIAVNESLDKANSVKEAEKIYQKIIKENKIFIKDTINSKIRSRTTNVAKSQPLYESKEAKVLKEETSRAQILAGIIKPEEK